MLFDQDLLPPYHPVPAVERYFVEESFPETESVRSRSDRRPAAVAASALAVGAAATYTALAGPAETARQISELNLASASEASGVMAAAALPVVETGTIPSPLEVHATTARLVGEGIKNTVEDWRTQTVAEKVKRPTIGTLAWANLVFGESVALWAQGVAQAQNTSNLRSVVIGVGTALAVETAFTVPVAMRNKEKQPPETVAEAAATALWLGGAMGVENKKLPLRQAPAAIGAYMIFGTALAGVAEYNDLAAQAVNHKEIIIPALMAWGAVKKVNEYFGYKGFFDRMADRSVSLVRRVNGLLSRRQRNG